jgi:hypothetical protein
MTDSPSATEFLRSVMHDRGADIRDRVEAAKALLVIEGPNGPPHLWPPTLTIRITLPQPIEMQRLFETFLPELQRDLLSIKKCYEQGLDVPDLEFMQVKGRA